MPQLAESDFERTVIYICAHSDEGAMGFIINRAQPVTFSEVLSQLNIVEDQPQGFPSGELSDISRPLWWPCGAGARLCVAFR